MVCGRLWRCAYYRYTVRMKNDALGLLLFVLGALLAQRLTLWLGPIWLSKRERRLAELRGGASERYFEERRSLEAHAPSGLIPTFGAPA